MSLANRFLFKNGVVVSAAGDTPPVAAFLETHSGAYTTTRTQNNASELLFWRRHIRRLSNSVQLLLKSNPSLFFGKPMLKNGPRLDFGDRGVVWDSVVQCLVDDCVRKAMPFVLKERKDGEELAVTAVVSGKVDVLGVGFCEDWVYEGLDVHLHVGGYGLGGGGDAAHVAVVGRGREFANAKYSDWVRLRKSLEKLRPPSVTELLLSNDGDRILEGCVTNFFVVCLKEKERDCDSGVLSSLEILSSVEIQTAPLNDGVLPGVIRQVIMDICLKLGITFREVAPSWSQRELWMEAFVTNSLRILQHVERIQVPSSWDSIESRTWEEITWVDKRFEDVPGTITSIIHEILERAAIEAFPIVKFEEERSII